MLRLALVFFVVVLATVLLLNRRAWKRAPAAPTPAANSSRPAPPPSAAPKIALTPAPVSAPEQPHPPGHAPASRSRTSSVTGPHPATPPASPPPRDTLASGTMLLTAALTRAGDKSAAAAAETFLWGLANNDTATLETLLVWTWRDSAWAQFRNVPQPYLMQSGSPDRLLAWALINDFVTVGGVQLLEHRIFGPNDEELRFRFHHADGKTTDESFLMRRVDGRWRREQWPTTIGNIAARLRSEKKPFIGR